MELNREELITLFEAVVKPTAEGQPPHPDPIGYMARVMLLSNADPDYYDSEGNMGFMPVHPDDAFKHVGAANMNSLENNVIATLTMDIMFFQQYGTVEQMIIAFHDGEERALRNSPSKEVKQLLEALPNARDKMSDLLYPRKATVKDVIRYLKSGVDEDDISGDELEFFNKLVGNTNG